MENEYFGHATIVNSPSNCKLSNIEYVADLYRSCNNLSLENKIAKIKRFLSKCRILVCINTIDKNIKDFFEENFEIYDITKMPIGYNNGNQYYIFIKNNDSVYSNKNYLRPVEKNVFKEIPTNKLEQTLNNALKYKAKRKKSDIIKEVIENFK